MKRTLGTILITFVIILCNGCGASKEKKPNFKVLDSKVDYLVIKDKKIYFTSNFKDFTLQFKGLGCTLNGEELDNIDENDSILVEPKRGNELECYNSDEKKWPASVNISTLTYGKDQSDSYKICYWGTYGQFDLHINNKTLLFGNKDGRTPSTLNDLVKTLGTNYDYEEDHTFHNTYSYKDGKIEYRFSALKENNQISIFTLVLG